MKKSILETNIKKYQFIQARSISKNKYLTIKELNGKNEIENEGIIIFEPHFQFFHKLFKEHVDYLNNNCTSEKNLAWDKVKNIILRRDNGKCRICNKEVNDKGQTHHIIERAKGGTNLASNLITVCGKCHMLLSPAPEHAINNAFKIPKEEIGYKRYKTKQKEKQVKNNLSSARSIVKNKKYETDYFNYNFEIRKTVDKKYILLLKQESKIYYNHNLRRIIIFRKDINKLYEKLKLYIID